MNVVVLGTGGHAKVVIDIIERLPGFQLVGLIDPVLPSGVAVIGHPILGSDADLPALVGRYALGGAVIAIGDNWLRSQVAKRVVDAAPGLAFPAVVHPAAVVARSARVGRGTVVMAGAVVNSEAAVGEFCILNTNCSVDHECSVGDFASVAPRACLGGNVTVGEFAAVSLGASVIHRVRVGPHAVVGAGATVVRDVPANVVAYGTPARVVRPRAVGDRYL